MPPNTPTPTPPAPATPETLASQMRRDAALRTAGITGAIVLLIASSIADTAYPLAGSLLMLAAIGLWLTISFISAAAWRHVPRIGALIEQNPDAAETLLSETLAKRPLQPAARLALYHRVAMLRHAQRRFPETAALAAAILQYDARAIRRLQPSLLLMLTDSALECGDLPSAYTALTQLHSTPLGLLESLQKLALQLRYEITCGHDATALVGIEHKVKLIELMPQPTCGVLHAMLAGAAQRTHRHDLAQWFHGRAKLLCTSSDLETYLPTLSAIA